MNKILKRDEYIHKVYGPMIEQKEYERLQAINEGILKNLFGKIKNMFKKDWETVKGDQELIKVYKEMDDKLTGFSTMKLSKKDQCNQIRQKLVDFAGTWYEYLKNRAEKSDKEIKSAKSFEFKDETLKSNLDELQKSIKSIADGDNQMNNWARLLMQDMKVVINQVIINEIDDAERKKEIEKQNAEELKKQEEVNKRMEKIQGKQLKEIKSEREKLISDVESTPVKSDLLGDKAIQNLCGEFDKIRKEKNTDKRTDLIMNDSSFGFKSLFSEDEINSKDFKKTYKLMDSFYTSLRASDVMKKFEETPGQSVQAMCISVNAFIKNCIYGSQDYGKALPLMAKCAVVSNGVVSYNLPLNDKGDGNYYTDIMGMIAEGKFNKDSKGKEIKLPDDFKKNASTLLNKIVSEAKKLKEDAEKKYNDEMKKFKLDDEETNIE